MAPVFTPRHRILLTALAAMLGSLWLAVFRGPREPSYAGKQLADWLSAMTPGNPASETEAAAVRAIGTNAIPFLLKWIRYERPAWKNSLNELSTKSFNHPLFDQAQDPAEWRADNAAMAFHVLGPEADAAIPELTRLMNTPDSSHSHRAAMALGGIGKAALPPLISLMVKTTAETRCSAFFAVSKMGSNALPALPIIVQCLADNDPWVVKASIKALGALQLQPALVVPALTNLLTDSSLHTRCLAMHALKDFGPAARLAFPSLLVLLTDPSPVLRESATNALLKIAPEAVTNDTRR